MKIAVTGATGFLGWYIVSHLTARGHQCRCWYRPTSSRDGFESFEQQIEWVPGRLGDRQAGVGRFVFVSTCAVHEVILDDRPLDETHPTWAASHYGAHKAAIEQFVYSYGLGGGYPICALRPTGIYGLARPAQDSKWFGLVQAVAQGEPVECRGGGKEVHAADVARAVEILMTVEGIAGQVYNCYDLYVSQYDVATTAKRLAGGRSEIHGSLSTPKHQIVTEKLRRLGMEFGGRPLLEQTIRQMLDAL